MNAPKPPVSGVRDYSASHLDKGRDYQDAFRNYPGRAIIWELEQRAIKALLKGAAPKTALDFATGTGRIARLVKTIFPDCGVVGMDISEKMLSVAKAEGGGIDYVQLDGRRAAQQLESGSLDLVTAFRFFPNADAPLRREAAEQIAELLKPGGLLLANNHRNFWSPTYVIQRIVLRKKPEGMLNRELIELFTSRGFTVERHVSIGVVPTTDKKRVLPWPIVGAVEALNYKTAARLHSAGHDTLYLFRKAT
jgi:SAM-dependent methyltransferase